MSGDELKLAIRGKGHTMEAAAKLLDMSRQSLYYILNKSEVDEDTLQNVKNKLHIGVSFLEERRHTKSQPRKNTVPFYDAEASGSIVETEMSPIHAPSGTIDIGDLLHDSEAAIRIYGNSMLPNYPPGCVVGLSKANEGFIEPGEVYVVETDGKRMLKRLFYKEDDSESDYLTLYSDNIMKFDGGARNGKLAYPPVNVHKKEIINLFLVTGVIKRNSNSIIMYRNNKP